LLTVAPLSVPESLFDHQALLAACARGERAALRRLYLQEAPALLGVARRLVQDPALAEDIVHEAFIRIWNGAAGFDPSRGSARGWMFSITRHLALNVLRGRSREAPVSDEQAAVLDARDAQQASADVAAALEAALQGERLHGCLSALEPLRRACIVQAYVDGFSHAEIAQRLATPLGTVKAWIKRSLASLKECMG
jgi:RNA polymerase sigma-70 factor (ECF subfamily)